MHLKRNEMPKIWPIERKGTKYVARPASNLNDTIPLVIVMRNILKQAKTEKEVNRIIDAGKININGKKARKKIALALFDVLSFADKNYRLTIENKKFKLEEISEKESGRKIAKIIGKKLLKKGKLQANLSDGRNYFIKEKAEVGDSAVIDFKDNKVSEIIQFKPGCKIIFTSGKHIGEKGEVEKIDDKMVIVRAKEKINTKPESVMAIK